ncbi:MAG: GNAT family N-acetyltransferase [Pseudomonadota bacterium]
MDVRQLAIEDVDQYKAMRLLGLKLVPAAFGGDYHEALAKPDTSWREALTGTAIHVGAFIDGALVGMANYERFRGIKIQHRAFVYGVFVHPDHVGKSVGMAVLTAIADHAKQAGVTQLHLGVGADNNSAKRLYEKAGFEAYGHEPSAIRLPEGDVDEILMIKFLH